MPNDQYQDLDWNELSSGLPDDFDGKITNVIFEYDSEYNEGNSLLLKCTLIDVEGEYPDYEMKNSIGKGWEPIEGGRRLSRSDGRAKNFNGSSTVGLWIKSLQENDVDMNALVQERQSMPLQAEFWEGLICHWASKTISYGGEIGDRDKLLPRSIIKGNVAAPATPATPATPAKATPAKATPAKATPAKAATKKAPAKAAGAAKKAVAAVPEPEPEPTPEPTPEPEVATGAPAGVVGAFGSRGIDAGVEEDLYNLAMTVEDVNAWQTACYENVEAATADPDVMAVVEDQSDGCLWNQAVADYEAQNA